MIYKLFIETLTQAVEKGDVTQDRIDDAVRRILDCQIPTWAYLRNPTPILNG